MATMRQAAQDVLTEARDGIAWIAVWKDGRGWMTMAFWPGYDEQTDTATMEDYEIERLQYLVEHTDPNAVIVNSYYHNLGDTEWMTRDSLSSFLRWQYEIGHATVADFLERVQGAQK